MKKIHTNTQNQLDPSVLFDLLDEAKSLNVMIERQSIDFNLQKKRTVKYFRKHQSNNTGCINSYLIFNNRSVTIDLSGIRYLFFHFFIKYLLFLFLLKVYMHEIIFTIKSTLSLIWKLKLNNCLRSSLTHIHIEKAFRSARCFYYKWIYTHFSSYAQNTFLHKTDTLSEIADRIYLI